MTDEGAEMKAVERLTNEMRSDSDFSEPDWDRMERALMARVDAEEKRPTGSRGSPGYAAVAALAAAAMLALGIGNVVRSGDTTPASQATPIVAPAAGPRVFAQGPVDGAGLRTGDRIEAEKGALAVNHAGHASWTLASQGRAVLAETGDIVTVKLEQGAISASVVPNSRPETFAIEVGDARIAVHGTEFRVEKRNDGIQVDVTEGVVAVGPASARGKTPGWLLKRGDSGHFRLDGRSGDVTHATTAALAPVAPAIPRAPAALPHPAAAKPAERTLTQTDVAKGLGDITHATESCFKQNTPAGATVKVQVRTDFTVLIAPDGSVQDLKFEPPLSPAVRNCVDAQGRQVKFPESDKGATATRGLLLGQ